jgi:hypothetical protein
MNRSRLFASFYFCKVRSFFTAQQLALGSLLLIALPWCAQSYGTGFVSASWHRWLQVAGLFVAALVLTMVLACWFLRYPGTRMMLVGNGDGSWSVHMAPLISFFPCAYARTPKGFLSTDTAAILRAAEHQGIGDLILLESQVLGAHDKCNEIFNHLAAAFPAWDMWQCTRRKPLGNVSAWCLNRLQRALMKYHGKSAPNLRPNAPVGLIVLRLRPRL